MPKQLRFDEQPYRQIASSPYQLLAGQKVNIVFDCNDNNNYTYHNNKQASNLFIFFIQMF